MAANEAARSLAGLLRKSVYSFYDKHDEYGNFDRQLPAHPNQSDSSEHRTFLATSTNAIRVSEVAWRMLFDEGEFHPKKRC